VRSPNVKQGFDIARANELLEAAGWRRRADGIRAKSGVRLSFVFPAACAKGGIAIELKAVTPAVYFGGDPANPDNYKRFLADMQIFAFPSLTPTRSSSCRSSARGMRRRSPTSGPA